MASLLSIRKRVSSRGVTGMRGGGVVLGLLVGLFGLWHTSSAADFSCPAGDVACLIDAINTANANEEENTLTLEAGTYTLTAVDNMTDGPNGLPLVTSALPLTILGAGAEATIIERAASAPAFRLVYVAATGTLTLEELTLQRGSGISGGGGIRNSGTLTLTNSTLSGNSVTGLVGAGGGIWNSGTLTLTNSTLSGNSATGRDSDGGGLSNRGTATLTNSTLSGNSATSRNGSGGGIINDGTLTLTNSTLSGNSATGGLSGFGVGGGISNTGRGATALQNTIVALNTAGTAGPDCSTRLSSGSVTSQGHNLVGDPTDCTLTLLPSDLTGAPGLDAFTDDGTPGTGHFPLLPTSPAIDAGNDAVCPATDQLGQPRVGICDIGAIEFQPALTSCGGTGAARVRGRVRTADRTGIGEVLVTLTGPAGCRDMVTTNAQGHYVFRTLSPGTYTVTVTKDACTFTPAERTVTLAASHGRARFRGTCP